MPAPDSARAAAALLLFNLEQQTSSLDELLQVLDAKLPINRDARFARQLALGAVRWQKRLDWMLTPCCSRPVDKLSPWARHILRLGTYQLFWLDRVPQRAAVHTSVELAKHFAHQGIAALVNAVLRRLVREHDRIDYPDPDKAPVRYLSVFYSHPEWLVERWVERWGTEFVEPLLKTNNQPAELNIRLNPLRPGAELELDLEPTGPLPGFFKVAKGAELFASPAYQQGKFQVQDPNAALAVALLDPQPGEHLLDLCSAPGGKATQAAAAMQDRGLVVAADISPSRLGRVRENARRLGLKALHPIARDGTDPGDGSFDRVLADVPCSATGVLGRRPDVRWHRNPDQLPELTARQQLLLQRAYEHLRPGGILVYSTCSLEREENEAIVERFLAQMPSAQLERADTRFPDRSWAGRYVLTIPGHHPGDGSFAARIRKAQP
ncbi:MAG: 16S rRNA (cytosine(967)-C(5))-methyltransferase RsmB [Candidatus Latescibacterota bacterium]|nr:16S rRNA (cytosine(967)-C(5))-methyltransferase RsmB [Candidatus Latescibacterota bacterium]